MGVKTIKFVLAAIGWLAFIGVVGSVGAAEAEAIGLVQSIKQAIAFIALLMLIIGAYAILIHYTDRQRKEQIRQQRRRIIETKYNINRRRYNE